MQPRGNSHYVTVRPRDAKISSETISADLDAFTNGGGQIEKLGNTPFRKETRSEAEPAADATAPKARR